MAESCILEWEEYDYTLEYSFDIIRRMRNDGVNVLSIWRKINADPECAIDYGDEIAFVVAWLLREAGAEDVTAEDVWRKSMGDRGLLKNVMGVFMWVCNEHFATSDKAPAPPEKKAAAKKKAATRKKATTKKRSPAKKKAATRKT